MEIALVQGGVFTDHRGTLQFVNETDPGNYRRFYLITHPDISVIRAWQGHLVEEKGFYVIGGSFTIAVVRPEDFLNPSDDELPEFFELAAQANKFLRVPGGSYTGIKANTPGATLLVLSGLDVAASKNDDYRQPAGRWVQWETIGEFQKTGIQE
ncbi:MAG: hypothetical protein WKI04_03345 [Ferruginibacter sp.]